MTDAINIWQLIFFGIVFSSLTSVSFWFYIRGAEKTGRALIGFFILGALWYVSALVAFVLGAILFQIHVAVGAVYAAGFLALFGLSPLLFRNLPVCGPYIKFAMDAFDERQRRRVELQQEKRQ